MVKVEGHEEENVMAVEGHESQSIVRDKVQAEYGTDFMGSKLNQMYTKYGDGVHTDLVP